MKHFNLKKYISEGKIHETDDKYKNDVIRSEVAVERKPYDTADVPTTPWDELSPEVKSLLFKLPQINYELDFSNEGFDEDYLDGDIQYYIHEIDEEYYFIDTQGFDYARYVGHIENFPIDEEDREYEEDFDSGSGDDNIQLEEKEWDEEYKYEIGDTVSLGGDEYLKITDRRRMFGSDVKAYTVELPDGEIGEYSEEQLYPTRTYA